jgi:hypothetical protein
MSNGGSQRPEPRVHRGMRVDGSRASFRSPADWRGERPHGPATDMITGATMTYVSHAAVQGEPMSCSRRPLSLASAAPTAVNERETRFVPVPRNLSAESG